MLFATLIQWNYTGAGGGFCDTTVTAHATENDTAQLKVDKFLTRGHTLPRRVYVRCTRGECECVRACVGGWEIWIGLLFVFVLWCGGAVCDWVLVVLLSRMLAERGPHCALYRW